jgi:hypothetical protein
VTNDVFISLVAGAWVGTTVPQSTVLERVIREVIEEGKTVMFAVKRSPPPPTKSDMAAFVESPFIESEEDQLPPIEIEG